MKKKTWSEPQVVVLVRNKPAEGVLNSCKGVVACSGGTNNGNCLNYDCTDRCWYDADS